MCIFKDRSGDRVGRLTVTSLYSRGSKDRHLFWYCVCDCGNITSVNSTHLGSSRIRSCGCLKKEQLAQRVTKHHLSQSAEYVSWTGMKYRCYGVNCKNYKNYGGRGITICDRWLNSFDNFLEDMGFRPTPNHSIDRFPDVNGNYEPSNCRWATDAEQMRNLRGNVNITINGKTLCATDWAKEEGVSMSAGLIMERKRNGWSDYDAVFAPKQVNGKKRRKNINSIGEKKPNL